MIEWWMGRWRRAVSGPAGETADRQASPLAERKARAACAREPTRLATSTPDAARRRCGLPRRGIELSTAVYPRGYELRWWMPAGGWSDAGQSRLP